MYLQWSRIVRTLGKTGQIIAEKTSGYGIQVDPDSPSFCWRDITTKVNSKGTGANNPAWSAFRGTLYLYEFDSANTHEIWGEFPIPHDYVPGTDLYFVVHWAQNVVDTGGTAGVPGVCKWQIDFSYADGFGTAGGGADPFPAAKTLSGTQQGSTTQYGHMVAEVQCTNTGGDATHIDNATVQVGGIILARIYRDPTDVADTLNQSAFMVMTHVHYQSTNIGTKSKSPDFYA